MRPSLKLLARTLDEWAAEKQAIVTETRELLVVGNLSATDAVALVGMVCDDDLNPIIEDGSDAVVDPLEIADDFAPFKVSLSKPPVPAHVSAVLTNTGFADWLSRPPESSILWCGLLENAFDTQSVRFAPWGDASEYVSTHASATARKIVREGGSTPLVPADVRPWLLKAGVEVPWCETTAKVWIDRSAEALFRSLCNEVEAADSLMFRGPPVVRYSVSRPAIDLMSPKGFAALQAAGRWVFDLDREIETRHGLLTTELARTNVGSTEAATLFEKGAISALEGAKIAMQLGLQKLSLDSLKALADLRKAISDEAAKLSDATRQIATAVAGALFAGIGVIAARLTTLIGSPVVSIAIFILGLVLCAYVAAVIFSGFQFINIQRDLRSQWRERLYRFLPEAEYEAMVSGPAGKSERAFTNAAIVGGVLTGMLFLAVMIVSYSPMPAAGPSMPQAERSDAVIPKDNSQSEPSGSQREAVKTSPGSYIVGPPATRHAPPLPTAEQRIHTPATPNPSSRPSDNRPPK
ncbi:hypothetical protein LPW26_14470 [Rhodopseudomonas sp. HC1]|uniref:hypothetical protein n=1 Tax=Rhodopseudomonas infernalis TaxID=2897386 RepID=UPI001EE8291D|nr:hypothetical protein [Rhodopseudomonas infernalis]MCG6205853.1 hypothetical protein [Rhodopseudomonas infernalis]